MPPETALAELGFTETEARLYCELLRGGPATGYRLAQAVGKAPANAYQALSALAQKGAVLVEEGEPRTFRAARPEELLAALAAGFDRRRTAAEQALSDLAGPEDDERIYQLKSAEQALQRARAMIGAAREIILFDLFPGPFAELRPALEQAALRGVAVAGLVYAATEAGPGVVCVTSPGAGVVGRRWPGAQLTLVADAAETLTALLPPDGAGPTRAVWSDSAYLACLQHNGLASELRLSALAPDDDDPLAHLSLLHAAPRGLRRLIGPEGPESSGDPR